MTEALRSYIVVLNYAPPGILSLGAYIAPDAASAAGLAAMEAAQKMRHLDPFPPLVNCLVVEEAAENLRHRLHAIEGKPAGEVVSLVRETPPIAPNPDATVYPHFWPRNPFDGLQPEQFGPPMPPGAA